MKIQDKIKMIKNYLPMSKYFLYSLLKKNQPLFGMIFQITNKCNSKCLMCFNWKTINKKGDELSIEEIEKFTKTTGRIPHLIIGGGEPFLHDKLVEICQTFSKNSHVRKIAIPTNSLAIDRIHGLTEKILKSCPANIKVALSIDGVGRIHDQIRGIEGNFDKVLENYKGLNELTKKYPKLKITVNTTISNKNENNISEIIDFVDKNLDVNFHTFELIRGSYNKDIVSTPSLDKYFQIIKQILNSKTINKNRYHKAIYSYYHKIAHNILKNKKQLIPCRVSSFYPVVDAGGNVYSCELLSNIGSLRDNNYDFLKIWKSKKAKQQRRYIANKKCYCTHYCYQVQNIPMSPWHLLKAVIINK